MRRYTTDRARPGLVALYDIRPRNGAGQFLQPRSPHGTPGPSAVQVSTVTIRLQRQIGSSEKFQDKKMDHNHQHTPSFSS